MPLVRIDWSVCASGILFYKLTRLSPIHVSSVTVLAASYMLHFYEIKSAYKFMIAACTFTILRADRACYNSCFTTVVV